MRTCIAVQNKDDETKLAFIRGHEVRERMTEKVYKLAAPREWEPTGSGAENAPFVVDSFKTALGYINKRNEKSTLSRTLWFTFFGVEMYQYGTGTASEEDYYLGLKGQTPLSYPDMAATIKDAAADAAIKSDAIKKAFGIGASNKYEVLAIACLFIAEGRRDTASILTHLMLFDLIAAEVKYGQGKTRSLPTAIDKGTDDSKRNFVGRYKDVTAAGDSPMSQKGAVKQAQSAREGHASNGPNRYTDKTISLAVRWIVNYYPGDNYILLACRPGDEGALETIDRKVTTFIEAKQEEAVQALKEKKKGKKVLASDRRKEESRAFAQFNPMLNGLKVQVLTQISSMIDLRIAHALSGKGGTFEVMSDKQSFNTAVLLEVLKAA